MIAIGICLPTFGTRYTQLRETARHIDALGFASIHVWDHYVSWNDPRESVLEAWTTLAGLAEATSRARIGPMVASNLNRHPGRLAKVAATLHELSGGRCDLGIGSGSEEQEQESFGIAVGDPAERVARLEEALQIIPALWAGEPVTFHGQYYHLTEAIASPPQKAPPRLIVAAGIPRTVRLAARYADGLVFPGNDRSRFPKLFAALDASLAECGRTRDGFDISLHVFWHAMEHDPLQALAEWEGLGFTRVIVSVAAPLSLQPIEMLARQLKEDDSDAPNRQGSS
jgi:alkanesulfonate monooxygenase SsuD/methylene tetrahydromethanopterin reductase-like flavin-dependent oxidoreductase (luciferase family)